MTAKSTLNKAQANIIKNIKSGIQDKVINFIQEILYEAMCASDGEALDSENVEISTIHVIFDSLIKTMDSNVFEWMLTDYLYPFAPQKEWDKIVKKRIRKLIEEYKITIDSKRSSDFINKIALCQRQREIEESVI
jgi:type I site-specific restriction-modification system R (restriction) subunit